ncbi:MAG: glycosyltransferase family 1 protein [Hahellaceae bacterium]|nr:glycosyltransferase family 1 protein [Hahellaceae bacterium]MCP5210556.1 glycosyltransferase family 1 protein [Hahellaceae bacterium]
MNILHLSNFHLFSNGSHYYNCDRKFSLGFIRLGHFVYDFSYKDIQRSGNLLHSSKFGKKKVNKLLLNVLESLQPDILLLGHVHLASETLAQIKLLCPNIRILAWFVDTIDDHRVAHFKPMASAIDALFVTTAGEPLRQLKKALQHIPCMGYLPNPVDPAIEVGKSWDADSHQYDLIYCGADRKAPERSALLTSIKTAMPQLRLRVCGSLGFPLAYGAQYFSLLSQSLCGLNFSKGNDRYWYSSDRIASLMGNGLCTFTPRVPGLEVLFGEDEVVYFDSPQDLLTKLTWALHNSENVKEVAYRGWQKAHRAYNTDRICKYMLEGLEGVFSEDYEWLAEYYR